MNRDTALYRILHSINVIRINIKNRNEEKKLIQWYCTSKYPEMIKGYKDIHKGERCFIIGNGPSLTAHDLNLIKNEYSFSTNKIYRILPHTQWKPYYYVVDDYKTVKNDAKNIKNVKAKAKFLGIEYEKQLAQSYEDSDFIILREKTELVEERPMWHMDICDYIGAGHTVTFLMVQLAIYMGFNEIYLIGNDCSYLSTIENQGTEKNHFYESKNDRVSEIDANSLFYAFESIIKLAEAYGVKIYNATRGGKLELFPRVTLESIKNIHTEPNL